MYKIEIIPFGKFTKYTLYNSQTQHRFSLVPDCGACVLDIQFAGKAVLDGYATSEELEINKWGKNVLLYPFPNRLRDGQYHWQGQTFQFPINDSNTGNALHGLGMQQPMQVQNSELTADFAEITCSYRSMGEYEAYPFLFEFSVTFRIENTSRFTVEMRLYNQDQRAIPVGMGWHPYFKLTENVADSELQITDCERIEINERMLPTGKRKAFTDFTRLRSIADFDLDNCFALTTKKERFEVLLESASQRLTCWQETGTGKFQFIQLFIPPKRQSIAIEPMTCNVDAFNNGEGLIILRPGETAQANFGFDLKEK